MILTIIWVTLLILGVLGLYVAYLGKLKDVTEVAAMPKGLFAIICVAMLSVGLIQLGVFKMVGIPLGPFGVTPTRQVVYQPAQPQQTTTTVIQQLPQSTVPITTTTNRQQPIQTFRVLLREKYSNKYDSVGNSTYGFVEVYPSDQDPQAPTSEYIVRVNVSSGAASATNPGLTTDTDYRVVFDGGGLGGWYDEDWGVIQFSYEAYQKNTGEFLFSPDSIARIATIDDILSEGTSFDTDGDINGQSTGGLDQELNGTNDKLTYNCTTGDGNFYIQPTLSVSGGNKEIKNYVMCFDWDDSNPPEGDEISDIVYQLVSGTDFGIPSNLLDHWAKEACIDLGANVKGGTSSKIKLSITVSETNLDTNDDWYLRIDDLGGWQAKDKKLNKGADYDSLQFDDFGGGC